MLKEKLIKRMNIFRKRFINALSNVEVVHFVEKEMTDPSENVKDMNIINKSNRRILSSNSKNEALVNHNYKFI